MLCEAVEHVQTDLSLCFRQITLCAHQCVLDLGVVNVVLGLRVPFGKACQCELAVQTAHEHDDVGTLVVLGREGLVALSATSVHECELKGGGGERGRRRRPQDRTKLCVV